VLLKILSLYSKLSFSLLYFCSSVYNFARLATLRLNPDKAEGAEGVPITQGGGGIDTQRGGGIDTHCSY